MSYAVVAVPGGREREEEGSGERAHLCGEWNDLLISSLSYRRGAAASAVIPKLADRQTLEYMAQSSQRRRGETRLSLVFLLYEGPSNARESRVQTRRAQ